ncbi:hypothetical protein DNTS_005803 [Danionella cerebrum]|uniref:Fibronectin type-III domain-containing protein n=1 Tax=Danionella cerebrum TaxID=2873325 RepID=A0A553PJ16_9TELE|nr:hypothetical protein DNTS_005803 [Danionella translucida]
MDRFIRLWELIFFLISSSIMCACYRISCVGRLLVDSEVIHMGSILTVSCHSDTERCGTEFAIVFNEQTIFQGVNCSEITTQVLINNPDSWLFCMVKQMDTWHTVCEKKLKVGFPPENPKFSCITHQRSDDVRCFLTATNETHLPTNFTVTIHNRTSQFLQYVMKKDDHVSIPRLLFDEKTNYKVHVRVIPSTPEITHIFFENGSLSPKISWNDSDDTLKPFLRYRKLHPLQAWTQGNITVLQNGNLLMREPLEPLIPYQFEVRVCITSTNCSMWSVPFNKTSPGIAPSHTVDVWRIINRSSIPGLQNVTLFWKHYKPVYVNEALINYILSYDQEEKVHALKLSTKTTRQSLLLNTTKITISAVTSAGSSPPSLLSLTKTGRAPPVVTDVSPSAEGSVRLSWDVPEYSKEGLTTIQGFVLQWQHSPMSLHWKRLNKDCNFTFLHEPLAGPDVLITSIGEKKILIQWNEVSQENQRGFITNFTIYFQRHRDKKPLHNKTVPHTTSRALIWELQGPRECFDVLVSAWNSMGEGPKGKPGTCCCPSTKAVPSVEHSTTGGMLLSVCLTAGIFLVILANLMYLKCVQQRMMNICMFMGISWIFENLPQFDNSNAVRLLKDDSYGTWEPLPGDSDPPLSPIEEVSVPWEREDSYPAILHVTEPPITDLLVTDSPYKPQLLPLSNKNEEVSETSEETVKEEDQFLLMSPSPQDFSWNLSFPVVPGHLNSFLVMNGAPASLGNIAELLASSQTTSDSEGNLEEIDGAEMVPQNFFIG